VRPQNLILRAEHMVIPRLSLFMNYFILIAVALIGFALGRKTAKTFTLKSENKFPFTPASEDKLEDMREEAREALTERTENRKEKILEMMRGEIAGCDFGENVPETNTLRVSRSDIEKLLDVSDRTAGRYLDELEEENKIKQIGNAGRSVYYVLSK